MTKKNKITRITPDNEAHWLELRAADLTSTECSALFNASPYQTRFSLWHSKADPDNAPEFKPNERTSWGNALEAAIAEQIGRENGWTVRPLKDYFRHPTVDRMGTSCDFEILDHPDHDGPGILEIKNVDRLIFMQQWTDDETPAHIEIQHRHQLEVTGYQWGIVAALVGGNEAHMYPFDNDPEVGKKLCAKVTEFWNEVDNGLEPEPDFVEDAAFICKLFSKAGGEAIDISDNEKSRALAITYKELAEREKLCANGKQAIKAEFMTMIGDADKAFLDGFTISAKVVAGNTYTVERQPYRGFTLTEQKKKKGA